MPRKLTSRYILTLLILSTPCWSHYQMHVLRNYHITSTSLVVGGQDVGDMARGETGRSLTVCG